jgi:hypothetical protein
MGANMRCKFPVAPQLKVLYHFTERCAGGWARRVEDPGAFGATPTSKTLLLNPYQLPIHGPLFRCVTAWSGRMPIRRLQSKVAAFPFRVAYCLTAEENRHPVRARQRSIKARILHAPSGMVCRANYTAIEDFRLLRRARFQELVRSGGTASGLAHRKAVSIAQYQGCTQHSVDRSARGMVFPSGDPPLVRTTGECVPASAGGSVLILSVKDSLWEAEASKWYGLASARTPKENQSAT